jgi:hypothetical protein
MATRALGKLYAFIRQAPTLRKFSCKVPASNVQDAKPASVFQPDKAYFQLRLSEMFLKNGRELWREFMPMAVLVTEFIFDGKQQTVPFTVSNDILSSIQKSVDGENVAYRNTKIAGPIPYSGGDLSLFTGLYRTKINDFSEGFFSLIGGVAQAFDTSGLSRYLDVAGPLGSGLANLLGMKDVEFRLGTRDELVENKTFADGYWVYLNAPEGSFKKEQLWVRDSQLFVGEGNSVSRFDQSDYCLVQIEHLSERGDYTTLPFHRLWDQAKALIWNNEPEKAKLMFSQLAQEVATSPDLTKSHRFALMQVYKVNFESESEAYRSLVGGLGDQDREPKRSGGALVKARDSLLEQYALLEQRTSLPADVLSSVVVLSKNWSKIRGLSGRRREFSLTNEIISQQLEDVQSVTFSNAEPAALADAMTIAAFAK